MIDMGVDDLLRAIREALTVPTPASPGDRPAQDDLMRDRAGGVRRAIDHALTVGDVGAASDLVDTATADTPVAYPVARRPVPVHCSEAALDRDGRRRHCSLEAGHEGDHMDWQAHTWEPPGITLQRLRERWGHTHRFAYLPSGGWLATAHDHRAYWLTETEPTPELLEESLQRHTQSVPAQRSAPMSEPDASEATDTTANEQQGEPLGGRGWVDLPGLGGAMMTHPDDE